MTEIPNGRSPEHMLATEPLVPRVASIVRRYMVEPTSRAALVAEPGADPTTDPRTEILGAFGRSWRSLRSVEMRTSLVNTFVRAQSFDTEDPDIQQMQGAARVLLANAPIKGQTEIRDAATNTLVDLAGQVHRKTSRHVLHSLRDTGEILLQTYPTRDSTVLAEEHRLRETHFKLAQRAEDLLDEPLEMSDNPRITDILLRFLVDPTNRATLRAEPGRDTENDPRTDVIESFQQAWRGLRVDEPRTELVNRLVQIQAREPRYWKTPQVQRAARVLLAHAPMEDEVRTAAVTTFSGLVDTLPDTASTQVRSALEQTGEILVRSYPTQGRAITEDERSLGASVYRLVQKAAELRGEPLEMPDFTEVESVSPSTILPEPQPLTDEQQGLITSYQTAAPEDAPAVLDDVVTALYEGRSATQIANVLGTERIIVRRTIERLVGAGQIAGRAAEVQQFRTEVAKRRRIVDSLDMYGMRPGLISEVTGLGLDAVLDDRKRSEERAWQPSERTQRFIDGILNNPVKIAIAIELTRRKDDPPTAAELDDLFVHLQQGQEEAYSMSENQAANFVRNSLIPSGFAMSEQFEDMGGTRYRITDEGEAGLALYGHMLALSEQLASRKESLSLHDFLSTSNVPGKPLGTAEGEAQRSPSTNLQIFSELVRLWKDKKLPIRAIDMTNITQPHVMGDRLAMLESRGILNYKSSEADAPLEDPFVHLDKSDVWVTKRQGQVLRKLVTILRNFERGNEQFTTEGLRLADEIMASPERMAKILRPMDARRIVGPEVYNASILEVFDAAEEPLTPRRVSDQIANLQLPNARRLIRGLVAQHELIETESGTAKRYRRTTPEERAEYAARLAAEAEPPSQS